MGISDSMSEKRLYAGNDSLPYQIIFTDETLMKDTTFLFYNNGLIVRDSTTSKFFTPPRVQYFAVLPNGRIFKKTYFVDPFLGYQLADSCYFTRK